MNFLQSLNPYRVPFGKTRDVIAAQREAILQGTYYVLLLVGIPMLVLMFQLLKNEEYVGIATIVFVGYMVLVMMTFMRSIPY